MKKIILAIILVSIISIMSACTDKTGKNIDSQNGVQNDLSVNKEKSELEVEESLNSFLKKVQGFWGYQIEGQWQVLSFADEKFNDFTYAGETWIWNGTIERLEVVSDNFVELEISYQEIIYDDIETTEIKKENYLFTTNDDYRRTLVRKSQDKEFEYIYLGSTIEELDNYIARNQITEKNINVIQEDQQPSSSDFQKETETMLSDGKIKSQAKHYFENELKNELWSEAGRNGVSMAITVGIPQIISRSEHTANVRATLNYTMSENGTRKTGKIYAVAIVDTYTGEILSVDLQ